MARETRIGLLVALVFIITFGLVLSELTGRPSPAGRHIRAAIDTVTRSEYKPVVGKEVPGDIKPLALADDDLEALSRGAAPMSLSATTDPIADVRVRPAGSTGADGQINIRFHKPPEGFKRGDTYVIQPGDSLGKIARKRYGDEGLYMTIYEANRDVLSDPSIVVVGQEIVLPKLEGEQSSPEAPTSPQPADRPSFAAGELPRVPPPGVRQMDLDQLARHFGADNRVAAKPRSRPAGCTLCARATISPRSPVRPWKTTASPPSNACSRRTATS